MWGEPTVLIVEDEPTCREMYRNWLTDDYEVLTARSGREALATLDEGVDVVLLDRRMAGLSGSRTARAIEEQVPECQIVMVTAVDPGTDIVALPIDDYVLKPVTGEELRSLVTRLIARSTFRREMQELFALASKKAILETECHPTTLLASEEYLELRDRLAAVRERVSETLATDHLDWSETFAACEPDGEERAPA